MNFTKNHLFCTSNTLDHPSLPPFKVVNGQDLKFTEGFCWAPPKRRHSACDNLAPVAYENAWNLRHQTV